MRLIDADLFLEFINAEMKQNRPDDLHIRNITRVLEDLPTAYDVDKVVEQLEELANSDVCCNIEGCPYMGNNDINCENCAVFQTIPIVKAGVIDE